MRTFKFLLIGFCLTFIVGAFMMLAPTAPPPLEQETERYDQPDKAAEYFRLQRLPKGEQEIPVEKYLTARAHMRQMPQFSSALNRTFSNETELRSILVADNIGTWQSLGPGNIGGRTRSLLINPNNPNIMYAGGVAGGVWKTTNGGGSWSPLTDLIANLAINSMAMDPHNLNVIYAGTGEGYQNADGVRGLGIFKTTDGGVTWTHLSSTDVWDFYYVFDLVVSPNDSNSIYALTKDGIWHSPNGGTTWTNQLDYSVSGICYDLAVRTDKLTDYLFASCRKSGTSGTIYRNTDASGSGTWQAVYSEPNMGRTSLAIAPSNQDVIYALSASAEQNLYGGGLLGVFRSTQSGNAGSWTARVRNTDSVKLNTVLLSNFGCSGGVISIYGNQGWYDNVIAVDPLDSNKVWAGGIYMFRSDDGGKNWGFAGYAIHPDQHVIVFPSNYNGTTNQKMFVGNDGGLYRTVNSRASVVTSDAIFCGGGTGDVTWNDLNNSYGVTQFYYGLPYPNGKSYFGGTQDNGTIRGSDSTGADNWSEIFKGFDGAYVAIHPVNTNILYAEIQYGRMIKSVDGGNSWVGVNSGINDSPPFVAPLMMDHQDPEVLWFGGTRLWRTTNGAQNWTAASQIIPPDSDGWDDYISAIGIAPTDSNYVLAGSINGGLIMRTQQALSTSGSTAWSSANPVGDYGAVSSVAFDPQDKNVAFATYSTFGVPHVWKSTDAGASWTNIDSSGPNGLPDIPVNSIAIDPADTNRLYVGTDMGVFVSLDGGANWAVENSGFANVVTDSLGLINVNGAYKLFAFTHGRGVFRVTLHTEDPNCTEKPIKPTLLNPQNASGGKKLRVALDWTDEICAPKYSVVVRQDSKKGPKVDGKTLGVSQYTTKQLVKGKTYYWQVKACNPIGCAKSTWWSFKIK